MKCGWLVQKTITYLIQDITLKCIYMHFKGVNNRGYLYGVGLSVHTQYFTTSFTRFKVYGVSFLHRFLPQNSLIQLCWKLESKK